MRFSTFSAIATLAATALAQDLSSIPSCGTSCVGSDGLAGTGCSSIDVSCICKSSSWISGLSCCVSKACNEADQQTIITFAQQICSPVGVTNLPTVAACTGSAAAATGSATASSDAGSFTSLGSSALASATSAVESVASSAAAAATSNPANSNGQHLGLGVGVAAAAGLFAAAL